MKGLDANPAPSAPCGLWDAGPSSWLSRFTPPCVYCPVPRGAGRYSPHLWAPLPSGFWSTLACGWHGPEMGCGRRVDKVSSASFLLVASAPPFRRPPACNYPLWIPVALFPSCPAVARAPCCPSPRNCTFLCWFPYILPPCL